MAVYPDPVELLMLALIATIGIIMYRTVGHRGRVDPCRQARSRGACERPHCSFAARGAGPELRDSAPPGRTVVLTRAV